jgi:chromosome partitioning protein
MAKIFCVANQKGGVGKTTTTVNLAAGLAQVGQRVLMIDLDPQGNATMGSGVDKRELELTVYDVLLESASIEEARVTSQKLIDAGCGFDVLGANRELAGAELELVDLERREKRCAQPLPRWTRSTTSSSLTARHLCRCSRSTACARRTA